MNRHGDRLSDAAAAEVGDIGIAPGVNVLDNIAIFEATPGTAPTYGDKNISRLLVAGKDGKLLGVTTAPNIFGAIEQSGWLPET